jgi:3D (Asp-Asp-Asp) domain-containing protein
MEPALAFDLDLDLERGPAEAGAVGPAGSAEAAAGSAVKGRASLLAELIGRIARGIKEMVPMVLAIGCRGPASDAPAVPPPPVVVAEVAKVRVPEEPPAPVETGPRQIGHFNITFYYVVGEEDVPARPRKKKKEPANDNQGQMLAKGSGEGGSEVAKGEAGAGSDKDKTLASTVGSAGLAGSAGSDAELIAAAPPEMVTLYGSGPGCEQIAETTREFADELTIQGTGKLRDGRVLNIWGRCDCPSSPCWKVTEQQWGLGGSGRPLQPFRTVAVDPKVVRLGSLLYIPLLEGRTMPGRAPWGGFVHDGCVVADDTGGAIRDHQMDFFVGRRGWFLGMSGHPGKSSWAHHIPVFDGSKICERKGRKISRKTGSI